MYITKAQMEERLSKTEVLLKEKNIHGGRKKNGTNLTIEEKTLIGTLAHFDTQNNVAEALGTTQATVSDTKKGLVGNEINEELKNNIQKNVAKKKEDLADTILDNLSLALTEVSTKIAHTDAAEASKIAVDMGKLLDKVTGNIDGGGKRTNIIINIPNQRQEKSYQVIDV